MDTQKLTELNDSNNDLQCRIRNIAKLKEPIYNSIKSLEEQILALNRRKDAHIDELNYYVAQEIEMIKELGSNMTNILSIIDDKTLLDALNNCEYSLLEAIIEKRKSVTSNENVVFYVKFLGFNGEGIVYKYRYFSKQENAQIYLTQINRINKSAKAELGQLLRKQLTDEQLVLIDQF